MDRHCQPLELASLCRYCKSFSIRLNSNLIDSYVDASHHGAKAMHSQSQTGLMIVLNGVPLRWRSTRQPDTSDSPAVSELYAIKEIVKDARLQHWVAEEMGLTVTWPFTPKTNSH